MRGTLGFTLIELVIAMAVAAVLLGVGVVALHADRFSVNQAATVMAGAVTEARFEAIRANRTAQLTIDTTGDGSYSICVDENQDGSCDSSEVTKTQAFGTSDLPKARVSATTLASSRARFDSRGIPLDSLAGRTITVAATTGTYSKTITLSATGRATIQ